MAVDFAFVLEVARDLPDAEESRSYGTPAVKVRGRLMARLWEDGTTLVLGVSIINRDYLIQSDPGTFFITEHYRNYPWVLVRLPRVKRTQLRGLLEDAWRGVAPKTLVSRYDAGKTAKTR